MRAAEFCIPNSLIMRKFQAFKSWRYFPHFQCVLDTTAFFFVCALDSTYTRTWPVAEQSGELAMNWTIDDGAIHSPNIGASMQNLF